MKQNQRVRRPKGYRTIVVDGSTFFWLMTVSDCGCCCDYHCYCSAQCSGGEASGRLFVIRSGCPGKLEVKIRRKHKEPVTPGDVELLTRTALTAGWDPERRGVFKHGPVEAASILSALRLRTKIVEEVMSL